MDRRSFLSAIPSSAVGVAAVMAGGAAAAESATGGSLSILSMPNGDPNPAKDGPLLFQRISATPGDPGERAYSILRGDGWSPRIFLDGVEQKDAVMADPVEGVVERCIATPEGNYAFNDVTGEVLHEKIRGDVVVVLERGKGGERYRRYTAGRLSDDGSRKLIDVTGISSEKASAE